MLGDDFHATVRNVRDHTVARQGAVPDLDFRETPAQATLASTTIGSQHVDLLPHPYRSIGSPLNLQRRGWNRPIQIDRNRRIEFDRILAITQPRATEAGKICFALSEWRKYFYCLGDLTHHQILLMERPRMQFSYDTDPKQAAESRVKMLDMLAANRIPVMSYHYPWPGYGHVVKTGEGFHYLPAPMEMLI